MIGATNLLQAGLAVNFQGFLSQHESYDRRLGEHFAEQMLSRWNRSERRLFDLEYDPSALWSRRKFGVVSAARSPRFPDRDRPPDRGDFEAAPRRRNRCDDGYLPVCKSRPSARPESAVLPVSRPCRDALVCWNQGRGAGKSRGQESGNSPWPADREAADSGLKAARPEAPKSRNPAVFGRA